MYIGLFIKFEKVLPNTALYARLKKKHFRDQALALIEN